MKSKQLTDIEHLWEQFRKTHDDHFRNLLMEHYSHLVKSTEKECIENCLRKSNWMTLLVQEISD